MLLSATLPRLAAASPAEKVPGPGPPARRSGVPTPPPCAAGALTATALLPVPSCPRPRRPEARRSGYGGLRGTFQRRRVAVRRQGGATRLVVSTVSTANPVPAPRRRHHAAQRRSVPVVGGACLAGWMCGARVISVDPTFSRRPFVCSAAHQLRRVCTRSVPGRLAPPIHARRRTHRHTHYCRGTQAVRVAVNHGALRHGLQHAVVHRSGWSANAHAERARRLAACHGAVGHVAREAGATTLETGVAGGMEA